MDIDHHNGDVCIMYTSNEIFKINKHFILMWVAGAAFMLIKGGF